MSVESVLNALLASLASYPIVQGAVALLILYGGFRLMSKGTKDGPALAPPSHDYPYWLATGPINDVFGAIYELKGDQEKILELMREDKNNNAKILEVLRDMRRTMSENLKANQRAVSSLEMIQNENVINPRRLQE